MSSLFLAANVLLSIAVVGQEPVTQQPGVPAPAPTQVSAQAHDLPGWGRTKWGMKPQEVLDLYKAEGATNSAFPPGQVGRLDIRMEHFKVVNHEFTVEFLFDDNFGLRLVGLEPQGELSSFDIRSLFTSLEKALTEKYGPATFSNSVQGQSKRSWMLGPTKIDLIAIWAPDGSGLGGFLSLNYTRATVEKGI